MVNSTYKIFKIITASLLSVLMLFLSSCGSAKYEFENKLSLSELSCLNMMLDGNSANNVSRFLATYYYEDDTTCGFFLGSEESLDLYIAHNSVVNAKLIGPFEQVDQLRNKLFFLEHTNINNMNLLNLIYYINICEELGYAYNFQLIEENLNKFYDDKTNLFFLNSENDDLGMKIMVTALCVQYLDPFIQDKIVAITQAANHIINNFDFICAKESTLYNCGGDIIYMSSIVGIDIKEKLTELSEWFVFWKELYEKNPIDSLYSGVNYCEFLKIAKIFEPDYDSLKISNYLNSLTKSDIDNITDMQMINVMIESVEYADRITENVRQMISDKNSLLIQSGGLFRNEINERATAFGIALSRWTNFPVNSEKINNYLAQRYTRIFEEASFYDKAMHLYYVVFIDQMINFPGALICDIESVQQTVDDTLDSITFETDKLFYDIDISFRLVEIVSDLQALGCNISLSKKQVEKIKKGISKALSNEEMYTSVYFTYIDRIDYILGLDLDGALFDTVFNKLSNDNGCKMKEGADVDADLYTTYMFIKSLEMRDRNDAIESLRKCIKSYEVDESVYSLYQDGQDVSILSTYLGCYIKNSSYKPE